MELRPAELRRVAGERQASTARETRRRLDDADLHAVALLSTPGAGRTTLLRRTLELFGESASIAVVRSQFELADVPMPAALAPARPPADRVAAALREVQLFSTDLVLVQGDTGLLAAETWDAGEQDRVILLAANDPVDTPLRYPRAFRRATAAVLTKLDLADRLGFDLRRATGYARDVNPNIELIYTSAREAGGLDEWLEFLRRRMVRRWDDLVLA
jgi:hydrogenase nickel incorporation protein HypB